MEQEVSANSESLSSSTRRRASPDPNNGLQFQFPASIGDGRMEGSLSYQRGQFAFIKSSFSEPPEIWYARDVAAECNAPADNPNACYEVQARLLRTSTTT